jgi:hypothetical protein
VFFNQVYNEKSAKKQRKWKDLKNLSLLRKQSLCKIVASEEINAIKKKPSTFHGDNRKHALRVSQKLARPTNHRFKGNERINSFEKTVPSEH